MAGQFPSFKKFLSVIEREALFARRWRNISSAIRPEYSISKSRLFLWNAERSFLSKMSLEDGLASVKLFASDQERPMAALKDALAWHAVGSAPLGGMSSCLV
jgi:hypothetical protein